MVVGGGPDSAGGRGLVRGGGPIPSLRAPLAFTAGIFCPRGRVCRPVPTSEMVGSVESSPFQTKSRAFPADSVYFAKKSSSFAAAEESTSIWNQFTQTHEYGTTCSYSRLRIMRPPRLRLVFLEPSRSECLS